MATRTSDESASHKPNGHDRGQHARTPGEIPPRGWLDILMRTKRDISRDNISLIAAGVAFYSLLAIPPALAASIALWGLFTDPQSIREQISQLTSVMPPEAAATFGDQLNAVANRSSSALGWTAIVGFLLSLWSARAAMSALIGALDIVYEEEEKRGFFRLALTSILLTLGAVAGGVLALLLIAGIPAILSFLPLGSIAEMLIHVLRWGVLLLLVMVGLGVLYRFAPSRRQARWRWVSWGAAIATVLWIAASAGFSLFVANFGKYNETYGTIAGVIVLLMWLWISAFAALVGAEINSEMELQTRKDTTIHGDKPMGRREAWVADHTADETH